MLFSHQFIVYVNEVEFITWKRSMQVSWNIVNFKTGLFSYCLLLILESNKMYTRTGDIHDGIISPDTDLYVKLNKGSWGVVFVAVQNRDLIEFSESGKIIFQHLILRFLNVQASVSAFCMIAFIVLHYQFPAGLCGVVRLIGMLLDCNQAFKTLGMNDAPLSEWLHSGDQT